MATVHTTVARGRLYMLGNLRLDILAVFGWVVRMSLYIIKYFSVPSVWFISKDMMLKCAKIISFKTIRMAGLLRVSVSCLPAGSEGQNTSFHIATNEEYPQNTTLLLLGLPFSRRGHLMKFTEFCLIPPSLLPP